MIVARSISILTGEGPDKVSIETELPSTVYPFTGYLYLDFKTAAGFAERYCREHFPGIPIKVKDLNDEALRQILKRREGNERYRGRLR